MKKIYITIILGILLLAGVLAGGAKLINPPRQVPISVGIDATKVNLILSNPVLSQAYFTYETNTIGNNSLTCAFINYDKAVPVREINRNTEERLRYINYSKSTTTYENRIRYENYTVPIKSYIDKISPEGKKYKVISITYETRQREINYTIPITTMEQMQRAIPYNITISEVTTHTETITQTTKMGCNAGEDSAQIIERYFDRIINPLPLGDKKIGIIDIHPISSPPIEVGGSG